MRGRVVERYFNSWNSYGEYIKYGEWLAEPRSEEVFMGEKLFIRQTGDSLIATYDKGNVSNNTLHSIYPLDTNESVSLYYLLGVINSKLLNWYYKIVNYLEVGKQMAEVKGDIYSQITCCDCGYCDYGECGSLCKRVNGVMFKAIFDKTRIYNIYYKCL